MAGEAGRFGHSSCTPGPVHTGTLRKHRLDIGHSASRTMAASNVILTRGSVGLWGEERVPLSVEYILRKY